MTPPDTIAAIATATGGGVGIVRISGPRTEPILRALVPGLPRVLPSHKLILGEVADPDGRVLDQVLAVLMRGPRSYTGEDVAELHGHGGGAALRTLLDAALAQGARLATPGEFTRRAFLAGKIDLTQAEAVASVIAARDQRALHAAQRLRSGVLGRRVDEARRQVVTVLAELEGALDFPDEAAGAPGPDPAPLHALAAALARLAAGYRRPLEELPEVVLVGPVNAGKSSLLNALCGEERALVDEAPGTTRDLVEAEVELDGQRLRLIDTAGVREEAGALERRGRALADARRARAALTVLVLDASSAATPEEAALRAALPGAIVVENKCDLPRRRPPSGGAGIIPRRSEILVSARTGAGLDRLHAALTRALFGDHGDELPVASARQAEALAAASHGVGRAGDALAARAAEVAAVELRRALHALGLVTGETVEDDVLDAIFARFCIGK